MKLFSVYIGSFGYSLPEPKHRSGESVARVQSKHCQVAIGNVQSYPQWLHEPFNVGGKSRRLLLLTLKKM